MYCIADISDILAKKLARLEKSRDEAYRAWVEFRRENMVEGGFILDRINEERCYDNWYQKEEEVQLLKKLIANILKESSAKKAQAMVFESGFSLSVRPAALNLEDCGI